MKKLSKIVSVVLSLALCLGMASPAFAASFSELQGAIDTGISVEHEHYAEGATGADRYKIEASKDEETGAVNVKLWEKVERDEEDTGISISGSETDVTIDLNGQTIVDEKALDKDNDHNNTIEVAAGSTLTVDDHSQEKTGAIQGSGREVIYSEGTVNLKAGTVNGSGSLGIFGATATATINIEGGSVTGGERGLNLRAGAKGTVSGENTTIEGTSEVGVFADTSAEVKIEGGSVTGGRRGLNLLSGAKGTVSGKNTTIEGASEYGVFANGAGSEVEIEGGSVTGGQRGLNLQNGAKGTVSGGSIKGNTGVFAGTSAEVKIEGGSVTGGERPGLQIQSGAKGTVSGEHTSITSKIYGVYATGAGSEVKIEGGSMTGGDVGLTVMNGASGTVSGEKSTITGSTYGAAASNGSLEINGGSISADSGDGVLVQSSKSGISQVTKTGGDISGNVAFFNKDGTGTGEFTVEGVTYSLSATPSGAGKVVTLAVKGADGKPIGDTATTVTVDIGTKFMPEFDAANTDNPRFELTEDMLDKAAVTTNGFGGYVDNTGFHAYLCCEKAAPVEDSAVAPTCTNPGRTAGTHCSVCGKTLSGGETIPATGHTEVIDDAVAASCTEDGLTEGKHCSVCEMVLVEQATVDALGHTKVIDPRVEPTTTSTGLTEGSHCDVCGEILVAQEEIPMLPSTTPVFPVIPDDNTGADTTPDTATIEDQAVPLAGLMPVVQLLEELRQYEKIEDVELPEDFKWLDHEYAQAIYWGLREELVADTEEDPFDPDEVITVALMREVLTNFVELYLGLDDFVVNVEGEDDEMVMDLGERLTAFYAELEAYLKAQESKAA